MISQTPEYTRGPILTTVNQVNLSLLKISNLRRKRDFISRVTIGLAVTWAQEINQLSDIALGNNSQILNIKNNISYDQIEAIIISLTSILTVFFSSKLDPKQLARRKRKRLNYSKSSKKCERLSILQIVEAPEVIDSPEKERTKTNLAEQIKDALRESSKMRLNNLSPS
jgi:hypothetical protein